MKMTTPQRDDGIFVRDLRAGNKITLPDGVFQIAAVDIMDGSNGENVQFVAGPPPFKMAAAIRISFTSRAPIIVHPNDVAKVSY